MRHPTSLQHYLRLRPRRGPGLALLFAWVAQVWQPRALMADDHIDYRYEEYVEDNNRMHIRTHSAQFEYELDPHVVARGQYVYDGISGATPTGGRPAPGSTQVPLTTIKDDLRHAYELETAIKTGIFTTTPQIAYSKEHDYESTGLTLNESIDFNQKNTTLNFGFSRNFDRVEGTFTPGYIHKNTWEALVGVNQLLDPKTYIRANFTLGAEHGYLNDPYRGVNFDDPRIPDGFAPTPRGDAYDPEQRPQERLKEITYLSITHFFTKLNGSAELSYRFYHDDWGIFAHTVGLLWNQKIGDRVTLSPMFRYYRQTAASFYAPFFDGFPLGNPAGGLIVNGVPQDLSYVPQPGDVIDVIPAYPKFYSADYRLAEMETFTGGLGLHVKVYKGLSFDAGYQRYVTRGLDGITPQSAFPSANIYTVGLGFAW